ncbi:MAG: thermonuclease family protein [Thermoleophilia bacterium]|nr:thermonuclease family protein [Thermoleophilia bacterium]
MVGWWKRRSGLQKLLLAVAAIVIVAIAAAAPSPEQPAATTTTAISALPLVGQPATSLTTTTLNRALPPVTSLPPRTTSPSSSATTPTAEREPRVIDVVDGDTVVVALSDGTEEVRLIGIDTPESGEDFSELAAEALGALVSGETVRLETDVETQDQYGRLLAYVWVGSFMANEELLRQGLATLYTVPPNVRYVERLRAAQDEAQAVQRGVWGEPADSPLKIVAVEYNAPGDDSLSLNEEYVVFRVLVSGTLLAYSVEDQTGHRYEFSDRVYAKGDLITLRSGQGTDTGSDLYWGASGAAIWNNDGDTVKVLDPQDQIVEIYDY